MWSRSQRLLRHEYARIHMKAYERDYRSGSRGRFPRGCPDPIRLSIFAAARQMQIIILAIFDL